MTRTEAHAFARRIGRRRYTVVATDADNGVVWMADRENGELAEELYRSAMNDPTGPVRRVTMCCGSDVILSGEVPE